MKKILITGCSSGFGLATARSFLERGWNVVATMRTVRDDLFAPSERLRVLKLDVTDPHSIRDAVDAAGPIDVLVNNAGVGMMSIVEGTPMETIRVIFETNLFGAIAMTQAALPGLRARGDGLIVNVSSSTTLKSLPMLAVYTASKAALNAFTESLKLELEPVGVRVSLVIPGQAPTTSFGANARTWMKDQGVGVPMAYSDFTKEVFERMSTRSGSLTVSLDVVDAIWRAVNDPLAPTRQPAGADAVAWAKGG